MVAVGHFGINYVHFRSKWRSCYGALLNLNKKLRTLHSFKHWVNPLQTVPRRSSVELFRPLINISPNKQSKYSKYIPTILPVRFIAQCQRIGHVHFRNLVSTEMFAIRNNLEIESNRILKIGLAISFVWVFQFQFEKEKR